MGKKDKEKTESRDTVNAPDRPNARHVEGISGLEKAMAESRELQRRIYLTIKQVSEAVGTGEANVRRMARECLIQSVRTSDSPKASYLIPIDEVKRVWPDAVLPGDEVRAVADAPDLELLLEDTLGAVLKRDHDELASIISAASGGGVVLDPGRWRLELPQRVVHSLSDDLARLRRAVADDDAFMVMNTRLISLTGPLLINAIIEAGELAEKLKPLLEEADQMLPKKK